MQSTKPKIVHSNSKAIHVNATLRNQRDLHHLVMAHQHHSVVRWPLRANVSARKYEVSPYKRVNNPWKPNFSAEYFRCSVTGSLFSKKTCTFSTEWRIFSVNTHSISMETGVISLKNDTMALTGTSSSHRHEASSVEARAFSVQQHAYFVNEGVPCFHTTGEEGMKIKSPRSLCNRNNWQTYLSNFLHGFLTHFIFSI